MNIKLVAIDLAKNVFQVCAINQAGKAVFNKKVSRAKLVSCVMNLKPNKIVMESCYTANYWGRVFGNYGIEVGAIPAQFVKPFVRGNKSDHNDALAIAEAAMRPNVRWVPIKTIEQQDLQSIHRIRERRIKERTALANQIRGLLSEYGITVPVGIKNLSKKLPDILEDATNDLTTTTREFLFDLYEELKDITVRIDKLLSLIERTCKANEDYQRLMTIPGFGAVVSSLFLSAIGDGSQFNNGRELSVWLGVTPSSKGSGDKVTHKGITKRGNRQLRTLLVHAARAAATRCKNRDYYLLQWVDKVAERRGKPKAWVALANKLARIAWALMNNRTEFEYKQVS